MRRQLTLALARKFGHKTKKGWEVHRQHHVFFNPTPFAVIADEYLDQVTILSLFVSLAFSNPLFSIPRRTSQFIRALPLLLLPSLFRINIDLLFFTFSTFFYLYGLVLHLGHEVLFDSHSKVVNTGYHHYLHHAVSTYGGRTWHTGFFLQAWDRMLGSIYTGDCLCAGCSVKRGERTREEFAKVEKPSYTELLDIAFWVEGVREVWAGKKGEVGVKGE
jgi:lathosterol oxidase